MLNQPLPKIINQHKEARFGYRTINARAETVADKPAIRIAFRRRRCLTPASGYFEWREEVGGRQPYCVRADADPFQLAWPSTAYLTDSMSP